MPIGSAVERRGYVVVYDEKGRVLFQKSCGTKPTDGLKGYTSTTVSIQTGSSIVTYDQKGRSLFSKTA